MSKLTESQRWKQVALHLQVDVYKLNNSPSLFDLRLSCQRRVKYHAYVVYKIFVSNLNSGTASPVSIILDPSTSPTIFPSTQKEVVILNCIGDVFHTPELRDDEHIFEIRKIKIKLRHNEIAPELTRNFVRLKRVKF